MVDDEESVRECFKEVEKRVGGRGLDFLVNNAGRSTSSSVRTLKVIIDALRLDYTVPAIEADQSEALLTLSTNFLSVVRINSTFVPLLRAASGTIVHIGSVAGFFPYVFGSVYNASKGALHSYTLALRMELAPLGIHVVEVVTGGVISSIARTKRELASGSPYGPNDLNLQRIYERRQGHSQEVGMPTKQYAQYVVGKLVNARGRFWNTDEVWAGAKAYLVWTSNILDAFTGGKIARFFVRRMFGFPGLPPTAVGKKNV